VDEPQIPKIVADAAARIRTIRNCGPSDRLFGAQSMAAGKMVLNQG
jgi:hypothetical protein